MKDSRFLLLLHAIYFVSCDRAAKQIPEIEPGKPVASAESSGAVPSEAATASERIVSGADIKTPQAISEWTRCEQGFQSSGDPARDVLKLGLMCGPVTGMQALGPALRGKLAAAESATETISLNKECIRVIAAANGAVADLELEVLTSSGQSLALANSGKAWTILPADGPLCVDEAGWYRIVLGTHGGDGEYALKVLHRWPGGDDASRKLRRTEPSGSGGPP